MTMMAQQGGFGGSFDRSQGGSAPTQAKFGASFSSGPTWGSQMQSQQRSEGKGKGKGRGKGKGQLGSMKRLRGAIFALKTCHSAASAAAPSVDLKEGLIAADSGASEEVLPGLLLGIAAAQAGRLGLTDLLEVLCNYAWSRLFQWGGREVAELTYAASHANCDHQKLFTAAAQYCYQKHAVFTCLRDVSLMSTAIFHRYSTQTQDNKGRGESHLTFDCALAFHGLSASAIRLLPTQFQTRDLADFVHAFSQVLHLRSLDGGPALCEHPGTSAAFVQALSCMREWLHMASPQDIAKFSSAASIAWMLLEVSQQHMIRLCLEDIAQAVRFHCDDFNPQDTALTIAALAKLDFLDEIIIDILGERVQVHASKFANKDLCLLLGSAVQSSWVAECCRAPVLDELQRRSLQCFSVKDLCMATQALAKLGAQTQHLLNLFIGEACHRELRNFSSSDKMYLLWAIAKSKVSQPTLCHMIVEQLCAQGIGRSPRGALSAALWSLAVLYPTLKTIGNSVNALIGALCRATPWQDGAAYEVANAAWAFSQLENMVPTETWTSLCEAADSIPVARVSLHELCNLINGFATCPKDVLNGASLLARFGAEACLRLDAMSTDAKPVIGRGPETLSDHDLQALTAALTSRFGKLLPERLRELVTEQALARGKSVITQAKQETSQAGAPKWQKMHSTSGSSSSVTRAPAVSELDPEHIPVSTMAHGDFTSVGDHAAHAEGHICEFCQNEGADEPARLEFPS